MNQSEFLDVFVLAERLHRQFLESIQLELDMLNVRDINNVRALMLLNIGDAEMTVSELLWRGCYLGSNVSYNLKKLTESGYVIQERSNHDKRVIMVRSSPKGIELCSILQGMNERHISALAKTDFNIDDLNVCRQTLRELQRSWSRGGHADAGGEPAPGGAVSIGDPAQSPRFGGDGRRVGGGYAPSVSTVAALSLAR